MPRHAHSRDSFSRRSRVPVLVFGGTGVAWLILSALNVPILLDQFIHNNRALQLKSLTLLLIMLLCAFAVTTRWQAHNLRQIINDRQFEYDRAERNARSDPLTGLPNRRAIVEKISFLQRQEKETRVFAMVDLDRFRQLNDLHGHGAGDWTLQIVSKRLQQEIGTNAVIARINGDSFAVLFDNDLGPTHVERLCRRTLKRVNSPFSFASHDIQVTCSIGLAVWTPDMTAETVISQTEAALRIAKSEGRDRHKWYDTELGERAVECAKIETALRKAITTGAIQPWFQPIVRVDTGDIAGFEVLARWTDPELGVIPPVKFIEIAEDCGLIGNLGFSLLQQACRSAQPWASATTISVNVSALQFHDPDLVSRIDRTLRAENFDPARLIIEVTESTVISDVEAARRQILALKDLGIAVVLDDFGTGYSSLASLRHLPFDHLKVDRTFVTGIMSQPHNQKLLAGIMALARGMELTVTAEGVETADDLRFLQHLECEFAQGFLFEAAIPADEVSILLETTWQGTPFRSDSEAPLPRRASS